VDRAAAARAGTGFAEAAPDPAPPWSVNYRPEPDPDYEPPETGSDYEPPELSEDTEKYPAAKRKKADS
jgi:hypothetical protein